MGTEIEKIEVQGKNLDIHLSLSKAFFDRFKHQGMNADDQEIINNVAATLGADDHQVTTQGTLALRFNLNSNYKCVTLGFEIGKKEGPLKTASSMLAKLG